MKLPNRGLHTIPIEKITGYLLNVDSPRGRGKALFFIRFGFTPDKPDDLRAALWTHGFLHDIDTQELMAYGMVYTVVGWLRTPTNESPIVRSVWIVDTDGNPPRLVSAYPAKQRRVT